jgi:hypothetical protein
MKHLQLSTGNPPVLCLPKVRICTFICISRYWNICAKGHCLSALVLAVTLDFYSLSRRDHTYRSVSYSPGKGEYRPRVAAWAAMQKQSWW